MKIRNGSLELLLIMSPFLKGILNPSWSVKLLCLWAAAFAIYFTAYGGTGFVSNFDTESFGAPRVEDATAKQKLIVFYAYMRGGSSFFGHLLTHNKDVFYWYEAEWEIYNRLIASPIYVYPLHILLNSTHHYRKPTHFERKYLRDQLKVMLTCQVDKYAAEQLTSFTYIESGPGVKQYSDCMHRMGQRNSAVLKCQLPIRQKCGHFASESLKNGCHKFMMAAHSEASLQEVPEFFPPVYTYKQCIESIKDKLSACLPLLKKSCDQRKYKAIKLLRADLDFVEDLMEDWDVKVVYLTRDPRGILVSREKGERQFFPNLVDEAPLLCQKMERDYVTFKSLEKKYPGKFLITSYENVAADPVAQTKTIYNFLDIPLEDDVQKWMYNISHAKTDGDSFDESRSNSSATSIAWRSKLGKSEKENIDRVCKRVYDSCGYEV